MTKCLIVDDVEVTRFTASQFLKDLGVDPIIANNGKEALSTLEKAQVDVVLLDWHLGDGTLATDIMQDIRNLIGEKVPIIIFSGVEGHENAGTVINAGANAFLQKPTTKEKLENCLRNVGIRT